jgi:WD40 repeat protein
VKLWDYDAAEILSAGRGHAGPVRKLKFSPDQKYVTSVGEEGAIFVWKVERVERVAEGKNGKRGK